MTAKRPLSGSNSIPKIRMEFHGATITFDAGLVSLRELVRHPASHKSGDPGADPALAGRPDEWPSREPIVSYHDFAYQAQSWHLPRRVVAKVE